MVADKVTLVTRKSRRHHRHRWESTGDGTYTIADVDDAPQGTSVTLQLAGRHRRPPVRLRRPAQAARPGEEVLRLHLLAHPHGRRRPRPPPAEEEDAELVTTTTVEAETSTRGRHQAKSAMRSATRSTRSSTGTSHTPGRPAETILFKAEGTFEYQALLFILTQAPFDLFMRERTTGVSLYVKRVFIMDDCEELMPGIPAVRQRIVVDAADLSLNVSREILQQDRQIRAIRRRLTKKVISTVADIQSTRPDDYKTFWQNFGRVFKEGLVNDSDNRDAILKASSFESTNSDEALTTLADYVGRMVSGQKSIYYWRMTGESRKQIENSPHLEAFRAGESKFCCSATRSMRCGRRRESSSRTRALCRSPRVRWTSTNSMTPTSQNPRTRRPRTQPNTAIC